MDPVLDARGLPTGVHVAGADGFLDALQVFMEMNFLPTDDAANRERILAGSRPRPARALEPVGRGRLHDGSVAARRVVQGTARLGRERGATDTARLRELDPAITLGRTIGSGHWHHVEVPDRVNAMIEAFLATAPLAD